MKKFLAALLTAALIISSSAMLVPLTVSAADEVPYENMIALYNMNGVMKDSVSGKSGTLKNGASFVDDANRGSVLYLDNDGVVSPGTGAGYDAEGQHAVLAESHIPNSNQMTISLWFNAKELRNWARVIDFGDAAYDSPQRFINIAPTNGTNTIGTININDSTAGIPNNRDRVWANLVNANEWVHAVLVINAGSGKPNVLYLNGVAYESTNGGAADAAVPSTFSPKDILAAAAGVGDSFLGRSRYGSNADQIFNGYIDDVAIFDKALTAAQVAALAKADLNSITSYPLSVKYYEISASESDELMTGKLIGAEGGWGDNTATGRAAAFDGDSATFYDPAEKANPEHYVGMQMEEPYLLTEIRILPREGYVNRFEGASIWGFNDETFDLETATLIWESDAAADAAEFQVITAEDFLVSDAAFTNFAYFNQVEHGDVAEVELYGVPESSLASDESAFDGDTITVGMVYLFAAEQIANVSNSAEALIADPNAYIEKCGLLTQIDKVRYYMETGYKFDYDAPITRQEYAIIIDRMFNILKKYGIEMVQNTEQQYLGSNIEQKQGIGRIESFSSATSEYGIGVMPYYEQRNVGVGAISSNNVHTDVSANSYNRQTLNTYTDGSEVRGSARNAVAEMFSLGFLKPKSFADKQIFFIQDPKAKAEEKVEIYSDEFYAKNEAAKERLSNYYIKRNQQVVLEKGLFIAPYDIVTQEELEDLITIFANTLKASGYTERAVMAPIMADLLKALEEFGAFETDVKTERIEAVEE